MNVLARFSKKYTQISKFIKSIQYEPSFLNAERRKERRDEANSGFLQFREKNCVKN
jgi:hypothetical protein